MSVYARYTNPAPQFPSKMVRPSMMAMGRRRRRSRVVRRRGGSVGSWLKRAAKNTWKFFRGNQGVSKALALTGNPIAAQVASQALGLGMRRRRRRRGGNFFKNLLAGVAAFKGQNALPYLNRLKTGKGMSRFGGACAPPYFRVARHCRSRGPSARHRAVSRDYDASIASRVHRRSRRRKGSGSMRYGGRVSNLAF